MKTKTVTLILLALLWATLALASDFPKMNLTPVESGKAMLAYNATTAATLEITLSNYKGQVVFFSRTSSPEKEVKRLLNFAHLESGNYCISVNYGNRSISRNLVLEKGNIAVGKPVRCYEPYFSLDNRMLNISFFNSSRQQVYASIYRNGTYVGGNKLGKGLAIQKQLNLSHFEAGEYEIVITDSTKEHRFFTTL